jgi:hypothetical protein
MTLEKKARLGQTGAVIAIHQKHTGKNYLLLQVQYVA